MDGNLNFFELGCSLIPDKFAQDLNSDVSGNWISFKNWNRLLFTIIKPDASTVAGDDFMITFQQATDSSGTGAAALTFDKIWYRVGTDTALGALNFIQLSTPVSVLDLDPAAGLPFTQSITDIGADLLAAVIHVEFLAERLTDGYKYIRATSEGDALGAASICDLLYIGSGCRYPRNVPVD